MTGQRLDFKAVAATYHEYSFHRLLGSGVEQPPDPVKPFSIEKRAYDDKSSLRLAGKFKEAEEIFLRTADLYYKGQNYFDSTSMLYKAGECAYALKDYEKAAEHFMKSADLSFRKGFDRFGVSAQEYARDSYKAIDKKAKVKELEKKIKEVKKKLEASF